MQNIKELRKMTNLSQSKFAEKYHLSVRTLQQWEQGISNPNLSLLVLIKKEIDANSNIRSLYKHNNKPYKICIDNPFLNCEKIYPIQQRKVRELIDYLKNDSNIKKIYIFGSSVTNKCHIGSDVDIYVESNSDSIKIDTIFDFEYDLWTNFTVDKRLKNEIYSKGVIVYERS